MDPIASCAESTLRQHVHPALRLSELVELVAERVDRTLDCPRLRAILERHPDRFRVLDPWRGPWRTVVSGAVARPEVAGVWVLTIGDPDEIPGTTGSATSKLRESVRWLGRGIDPRSPSEVSRWHAIAIAERAVRSAVARRAA